MHQEALSSSKQDVYVPQCKLDGAFEEVQCYGPSNECWCVGQEGSELKGTRRKGPLKCTGLGLFNVCCCCCYNFVLCRSCNANLKHIVAQLSLARGI